MSADQITILAILVAAIGLFIWGRWRHDMVAMAALIAVAAFGLVPAAEVFAGFGHPAVVTVACVLVLSRGLQNSGAIDILARRVLPAEAGPMAAIAALTGLGALLSGFMNNVGALALLMPLALQLADRLELPSGKVLMPLAMGSILGGMTTLIGTPPNLIVSGFRARHGGEGFSMFDFTPVGVAVAGSGLLFIILAGRFLVPARKGAAGEAFEIAAYLTEAVVEKDGRAVGKSLREVERAFEETDAQIVGLVRDDVRLPGPHPSRLVQAGDILIIEADPKALASALSELDLRLAQDREAIEDETGREGAGEARAGDVEDRSNRASAKKEPAAGKEEAAGKGRKEDRGDSDEVALAELAVLPDSALIGRSATELRLRTRHGINLLAISRQGRRRIARLRSTPLRAGDVLLLQGAPDSIGEFAGQFGCVPLAERALRLPDRRSAFTAVAIMAAAVLVAAFELLPAAVAFAGGVLACMVTRVVPPRSVYDAVDWPVIVLLAALIPVAGAMAATGTADLLARGMIDLVATGRPVLALVIVMVVTMLLSAVVNNAATAAIMCPIAIGTAAGLEASADPYLMAVAVGASCAFLTPIAHQNNTLILGPGGFRFGDYWRLGLPLEIIAVAVGVPVILFVWPP